MTEGKGLMCWQNQAIILPPLAIHPKSRCIAQDRARSGLLRRPFTALVLPIGTEYLINDGLVDTMCGEPFGNALTLSAHLLCMPLLCFGISLFCPGGSLLCFGISLFCPGILLFCPGTALFGLAHLLGMPLCRFCIPFVRKLQDLSAHGFPHLSLQGNAADIIYAC